MGLEGLGVECMGFSSFPEREQLVAKLHNAGIGDVFQPQIEGIGQRTSGFLASEHASVQHLAGRFLGLPTSGTHKPIGQRNPLSIELNRGDHAVTIKGMVNALTVTLQQPRAIAIEGSQQFGGHLAPRRLQRNIGELLLHIAEGTGPFRPVEAFSGGSDGHGEQLLRSPSSRNGL